MIFLAILIFLIGLLMIFKPDIAWMITEQWKSEGAEGPSEWYVRTVRIGGVAFVLSATAGLIVYIFL